MKQDSEGAMIVDIPVTSTSVQKEERTHIGGISIVSSEQKTKLARAIYNNQLRQCDVWKALNLAKGTVSKWVSLYEALVDAGVPEDEISLHDSKASPPPYWDKKACDDFVNMVEAKQTSNNAIRDGSTEATKLILKLANASAMRRGHAPLISKLPTKQTLNKILDACGVSKVKGRRISQARVDAVDDPRNPITHAAAVEVMCKGRSPSLVVNWDTTQFSCRADDAEGKILVSRRLCSQGVEGRSMSSGELAVFIKYLSIYWAIGNAAPPILIVANDNLDSEEIVVEKVFLLSHLSGPLDFGYIMWVKSRGMNLAAFQWCFEHVLIPLCREMRESLGFDLADPMCDKEAAMTAFFMDGEQLGVAAANSETVVAKCREELISLNKYPASTSLIYQLCDLATIYRDTKKDVHDVQFPDYNSPALEKNINEAFLKNEEKLKLSEGSRKKHIRALLKIIYALKTRVTHKNIVDAAKKANVTGDIETWDEFNTKSIFGKCTHKFTVPEWAAIEKAWPAVLTEFREKGQISDAFMDEHDLPRGRFDDVFKENRSEYRWRSALLNHEFVLSIVNEQLKEKESSLIAQEERRVEADRIKASKVITAPFLARLEKMDSDIRSAKPDLIAIVNSCERGHIDESKRRGKEDDTVLQLKSFRDSSKALGAKVQELHKDFISLRDRIKEAAKRGDTDLVILTFDYIDAIPSKFSIFVEQMNAILASTQTAVASLPPIRQEYEIEIAEGKQEEQVVAGPTRSRVGRIVGRKSEEPPSPALNSPRGRIEQPVVRPRRSS